MAASWLIGPAVSRIQSVCLVVKLVTLRDAAAYIMKLPKAEQDLEEWQTATGCLIGAAEGRDFLMHSRIGMLRALNRNTERVFNPDRKDTHWAKRKLARDR